MIHDIFARRYETATIRTRYFEEDRRFMNQAAMMLMDPLWLGQTSDAPSKTTEENMKIVHDKLAMEVGHQYLSDRYWWQKYTIAGNEQQTAHTITYAAMCKNYLIKVPPDVAQGDAWVKERLSLVEIAFQQRWQQVQFANRQLPAAIAKAEANDELQALSRALKIPGLQADGLRAMNAKMNAAFEELVRDLNERLRLALYKLSFHNGLIQISDDALAATQIAKPFWALVSGPQWSSVDEQIKEAIDRRDNGDRTAAFHAVCALESAIKVISDVKGWTTGTEKGAANYIANLNSKANGRFIELWEAEMLTKMFGDVRNPFAHGPGQAPMPKLTPEQTDWAIDTAMSWIRGLVRRL